jgi:hypothetical protein
MFKAQGTVLAILPEVTGQSPKGMWVKQSCVIQHVAGEYPKQMEVTGFSAVAGAIKELTIGSEVEVTFQIESREYQGRYYTTCFAINITRLGAQSPNETVQDEQDLPF